MSAAPRGGNDFVAQSSPRANPGCSPSGGRGAGRIYQALADGLTPLASKVVNLSLMVPVGIVAYFLTEMEYPIAPLVIGVILGPMADENLRRGLMVANGDASEFFTRPWCIDLLVVIGRTVATQIPAVQRYRKHVWGRFMGRIGSRRSTLRDD